MSPISRSVGFALGAPIVVVAESNDLGSILSPPIQVRHDRIVSTFGICYIQIYDGKELSYGERCCPPCALQY